MAVWMTMNEFTWDQLRPVPVHLAQPDALVARGASGAHHHDEPEPTSGQRTSCSSENDYIVNLKSEIGIQTLIKGQTELMARLSLLERQLSPVASRRQ